MKVFISWSGERSQIFAQALHDWLPMVLQSVVPWLSHADIAAGDRWADTIAKELDDSNFGITCVTRENISSPWILFEAGALAKRMQEGRVIPLLLDIEFKDVTGPLAQFQAKKAERGGLFDVINSINQLSDVKVSESLLPKQFEALWLSLEKKIEDIPKNPTPARQHRPQQEILEELVSSIRGLDVIFRNTLEEVPGFRRRRSRFHPMMIREVFHFSQEMLEGPTDPVRFLIMASFFRDEVPWLYELAVDAYHETVRRSSRATTARRRLFAAIKAMRHGPWLELFESKEMHMLFRELEHLFYEIASEIEEPEPERLSSKSLRKNAPSKGGQEN